jgi:septum site-determining protein MinC
MDAKIISSPAFKLKGRLYTLTVIHLVNADKNLFTEQLQKSVQTAPLLFKETPVIIDCSFIKEDSLDLTWIVQLLRENDMLPIAVQAVSQHTINQAKLLQLGVLSASASQDKSLATVEKTSKLQHSKLYTQPVRSGQQIVSTKGDLTITATVSHGAELLSSGNIHIYGALRGRALAGINGDRNARIFCQSFEAELVAIAGIYCLSESLQHMSKPCQIFLQDNKIQIEAL